MALTGKPPYTVSFTDASQPVGGITYWQWDFGDGTSYEGQDPDDHLYASVGVYTVTLHVASAKGMDTASDTVTVALDAFTTVFGLAVVQPMSVFPTDFIQTDGDYTVFGLSRTPGGPWFTEIAVGAGDVGDLTLYVIGCYGAYTLELPVTLTVT